MKCIKQYYELHGLEDTIQKFHAMKADYGGFDDWTDIEAELRGFIIEKKKQADESERERQWQMYNSLAQDMARNMNAALEEMVKRTPQQAPPAQYIFQQPVGIVAPGSTITPQASDKS